MARAGRKRKQGKRTPSGRLSRAKAEVRMRMAETERQAMATVLEARQRLFGVTERKAKDPMAGTAVGRLCLSGQLSADQYDVAVRYMDARASYQSSMLTRKGGGEGGSIHDVEDSESYERWCEHARKVWDEINAVLNDLMVSLRSPAPRSALDVIVVRDVDYPEGTADLRLALNALERFFSGQRRRAA
jgi:hypothetical protein